MMTMPTFLVTMIATLIVHCREKPVVTMDVEEAVARALNRKPVVVADTRSNVAAHLIAKARNAEMTVVEEAAGNVVSIPIPFVKTLRAVASQSVRKKAVEMMVVARFVGRVPRGKHAKAEFVKSLRW